MNNLVKGDKFDWEIVIGLEIHKSLVNYSIKRSKEHLGKLFKYKSRYRIIHGSGWDGYPKKSKKEMMALGGRIGKFGGGMGVTMPSIPTGMPRVNTGGIRELDYRQSGGFVPVGVKEKADDVPAMLSKNEFVMTADAVKAAGGGSVEKGAQRMYDTMKRLEGKVV